MPAEFISLAVLLLPAPPVPALAVDASGKVAPSALSDACESPLQTHAADTVPIEQTDRNADAIGEFRRFRAMLADALAQSTAIVLRDLACEILARELTVAPCAIEPLVARLVRDHLNAGPLRVRISPHDREAACDLPIAIDASLQAGDAVLECFSGSIDARLGVRLRDVLDRASDRR